MIIDDLDDAVLDEVLFDSLNLAFPLWTRKWLALLETDADVGIRIKKDLKLGREVLGFSFSSNRFGLRGPCDPTSSTAVFGTSYAMGFSVDDGDNWYDGFIAERNISRDRFSDLECMDDSEILGLSENAEQAKAKGESE